MRTYYKPSPVIALFFLLLFSFNPAGAATSIINGEVNKLIRANLPVSPSRTDKFKNRYVVVLKFLVTPGQKYTLDVNYPVDKAGRSIQIYGYNPVLEKSLPYDKQGGIYVNFTSSSPSPCPPPPGCWLTEEFNIEISGDSPGRYLYVAIVSKKASLKNSVILRFPALPDKLVTMPKIPPLCPPLDGKYYCGKYNSKVFRGSVKKVFLQFLDANQERSFSKSQENAVTGFIIEAENEMESWVFTPEHSKNAYQWRSRKLANLPHSGKGYWYLSRKGDWLLYVFDVSKNGNYKLWIKDFNDLKHPPGARTIIVNIDCEKKFRVPENTSPKDSGWGWHLIGTIYLKKGKHIMKIEKEATTSAAALIDAYYITQGTEYPGI